MVLKCTCAVITCRTKCRGGYRGGTTTPGPGRCITFPVVSSLTHWACVTRITSQSHTHTHRYSLKSRTSANLLQFKQYIDLKISQDYTVWQLIWVLF